MRAVILLPILLMLIPVATGYPIKDFRGDFPGSIVAGNTYLINFSFVNEHSKSISSELRLNISNVNSYGEFSVNFSVNGEHIETSEVEPGFFKTDVFSAIPGNNKIELELGSRINLAPGNYEFSLSLYTEEVKKEEEKARIYHRGGRIIVPPTPTPELTIIESAPTPTVISTPVKPTVTPVPSTPPSTTPSPTPVETVTMAEQPEKPNLIPYIALIAVAVGVILIYLWRK